MLKAETFCKVKLCNNTAVKWSAVSAAEMPWRTNHLLHMKENILVWDTFRQIHYIHVHKCHIIMMIWVVLISVKKKNWYKNKTKHSVSFVVMYDRDIYSSM